MEYTEVTSTNVFGVGYDLGSCTLLVDFLNGSQYLYFEVPPDLADGLVNADSVGGYLAKHIKGKYEYRRLR
ncbi:MAG: KTSC domain-containing protein [Terriglobales bacterium]|jgi:hypothetical protein